MKKPKKKIFAVLWCASAGCIDASVVQQHPYSRDRNRGIKMHTAKLPKFIFVTALFVLLEHVTAIPLEVLSAIDDDAKQLHDLKTSTKTLDIETDKDNDKTKVFENHDEDQQSEADHLDAVDVEAAVLEIENVLKSLKKTDSDNDNGDNMYRPQFNRFSLDSMKYDVVTPDFHDLERLSDNMKDIQSAMDIKVPSFNYSIQLPQITNDGMKIFKDPMELERIINDNKDRTDYIRGALAVKAVILLIVLLIVCCYKVCTCKKQSTKNFTRMDASEPDKIVIMAIETK